MRRAAVGGLLVLIVVGAIASVVLEMPVLFLGVALAAVGLVALVVRARRGSPATPAPPVEVPPEETELEEGPITACMRCGSPRVRQTELREGGIPGGGAGLAWICARCGHRGPALEFDDVTAYRQFVKGLNERP